MAQLDYWFEGELMLTHMKRRVLPALAAVGTIVLIAGCSGTTQPAPESGNTSDPGASPSGGDPVKLRMTIWSGNEAHLELFNSIADEYIAANPDKVSEIAFETLPYDDYTQVMTTQIAGGNAPDLAWILEATAPEFLDSGALIDLAPTLKDTDGYELDDLLPSALELWTGDDGAVHAYPFSNSPFGLLVNTTLLAEAGQPLPADLIASGDWTWDKVREITSAAATATGKAGFYFPDSDVGWWYMSPAWDGWGAAPWSEDGKTCTFTDQAMVDYMTWYHDAIFVDGAVPQPGVVSDFFAGEAVMITSQISKVAALDGSFEWDIVPLPAGPAKTQPVIGQAGLGVLAAGQNPEIAADFLAFFTNPTNAAKLAAFFPPPRESLLNVEVLGAANPLLTPEQIKAVVVDQVPAAITMPSHVSFAEVSDIVRSKLDAFYQPGADVPAVLGDVCAAIEPKLGS